MKIGVTSKSFSRNAVLREKLKERYQHVVFNDAGIIFNETSLIEFLKGCEKAIIGLEKLNDKVINSLPDLKVVSKYGVGLDNIDFNILSEREIFFGYTPGTNKRGVAELALQMMLLLIRKSYKSNLLIRKGEWIPQFGNNLTGKAVGILGLGNVGKDLVTLLKPFECKILCHDINPDFSFIKANQLEHLSLTDLFKKSQVISVHIPLNESTKGLVGKELLSLMNAESILINTSRGGIVDETNLFEILKNEKILAAGFDVFAEEPCKNMELLQLENFFSTPHIGGSSQESVLMMGMAAINGLDSAQMIKDLDFL